MENEKWKYIKRNNSVLSTKDLRLLYKRQTGRIPNGSYLSLDGRRINANLDPELSDYIEWLENVAVTQLELTKKLIPWEPIKNKQNGKRK